jgi:predicted transport protein
VNQRHACGAGSVAALLAGKPPALASLFRALEKTVRQLSGVEIVAHDRYALFRTTRIFADVVIMKDALRLNVLLDRPVKEPLFFKVLSDRGRVAHVAKLRSPADLRAVTKYVKQAHAFAAAER